MFGGTIESAQPALVPFLAKLVEGRAPYHSSRETEGLLF
jgi:hypothetical protein